MSKLSIPDRRNAEHSIVLLDGQSKAECPKCYDNLDDGYSEYFSDQHLEVVCCARCNEWTVIREMSEILKEYPNARMLTLYDIGINWVHYLQIVQPDPSIELFWMASSRSWRIHRFNDENHPATDGSYHWSNGHLEVHLRDDKGWVDYYDLDEPRK